jgi:hypothetical protein
MLAAEQFLDQLQVSVAVVQLTVLKGVRKPLSYLQNVFTFTMMTFLPDFGLVI